MLTITNKKRIVLGLAAVLLFFTGVFVGHRATRPGLARIETGLVTLTRLQGEQMAALANESLALKNVRHNKEELKAALAVQREKSDKMKDGLAALYELVAGYQYIESPYLAYLGKPIPDGFAVMDVMHTMADEHAQLLAREAKKQ